MIFGFTYVIYKYFLREIMRLKKNYNLNNALLVHAGAGKNLKKKKYLEKNSIL